MLAVTNPLLEYARREKTVHKWTHYFEIYHRHLEGFRGRSPVVVEVGVFQGGSLGMWRNYFGEGCQVFGIDVNPECARFENVLIGDQADRKFLAEVRERLPRIDIMIDDGGHSMAEQITTFEELFPHVQPEGFYICEDTHTSYKKFWGGGGKDTFLEMAKGLIDSLHGWHRDSMDEFAMTAYGMHFYESVLVIEKRPIEYPSCEGPDLKEVMFELGERPCALCGQSVSLKAIGGGKLGQFNLDGSPHYDSA